MQVFLLGTKEEDSLPISRNTKPTLSTPNTQGPAHRSLMGLNFSESGLAYENQPIYSGLTPMTNIPNIYFVSDYANPNFFIHYCLFYNLWNTDLEMLSYTSPPLYH